MTETIDPQPRTRTALLAAWAALGEPATRWWIEPSTRFGVDRAVVFGTGNLEALTEFDEIWLWGARQCMHGVRPALGVDSFEWVVHPMPAEAGEPATLLSALERKRYGDVRVVEQHNLNLAASGPVLTLKIAEN